MHTGFEVSVSREYGGGDEVTFLDGIFNFWCEGTGVTNAGGAAVTNGLEAELIEFRLELGGVKIIGDNPGTGSE